MKLLGQKGKSDLALASSSGQDAEMKGRQGILKENMGSISLGVLFVKHVVDKFDLCIFS